MGFIVRWSSFSCDPGVYHMYNTEQDKIDDDRYIHSFRPCPGGGTIVVTCVPELLALVDDVTSFEADTTFKRVAGPFNEWEVVIFYKALNRSMFPVLDSAVGAYTSRFDHCARVHRPRGHRLL